MDTAPLLKQSASCDLIHSIFMRFVIIKITSFTQAVNDKNERRNANQLMFVQIFDLIKLKSVWYTELDSTNNPSLAGRIMVQYGCSC
ncbi:hypothetical protein D3C73_1118970 [compost metagenome]